jgi:1,2-phenylacetyl-CoA epoxidase catalytic subunit
VGTGKTGPPPTAVDVHDLDPAAFYEEVHSFEFWFQAVEGYLSGLTWGHRPETPEAALSPPERDRLITVLCNYCVGETAALEGASGLIAIAPNRLAKVFLATQVADEGRHLEVFYRRMRDLGVVEPEAEVHRRAARSLLLFQRRLLELVAGKDWEAAIFAQNVILESLEFAVFHSHAQTADPITAEILRGVIKDERRHIGFGENELGRRLASAPHIRARIGQVKKEMDHLVLDALEETALNIGLERDEQTSVGRVYLESVERLGFPA